MTERIYTVTWTETALTLAEAIPDQRVKRGLHDRAGQLANSPEQQGKALVGELEGFRSVRAIGQRYRIVYRVERQTVTVTIVAAGRRKDDDKRDVYALAKKLLRQGLLK
jgi:mRNA interferase RelE/StbE